MAQNLKPSVLAACRQLLRPVTRMLLKHGVMHREFVELSKELYVDIARNEYGLRGRPTNVSRVALLTGLGRKEITRVRNKLAEETGDDPQGPPQDRQDRIARVLAGWYQDPDYLDDDGKPMHLPLEGSAPSYEDLIRRYGGDVPSITIQRELLRVKAVRLSEGDLVEVLRRNYRMDTADPEALNRAGSVLEDLGKTVTHNLYHGPKEPTRFEARASNVNISAASLPEYREFIYAESQLFLERVDAWLSRHEISEQDAGGQKPVRLGIGMYWIQSDVSQVLP